MPHAIVPPAVAFVAGLLLAIAAPWPPWIAASILLACLAGAIHAHTRQHTGPFMAALAAACASAGIALASRAEHAARDPPVLATLGWRDDHATVVTIEGTLQADASAAATGTLLAVDVDRLCDGPACRDVNLGVLVTVGGRPDPDRAATWRGGRRIRAPTWLRRPSIYLDPGVPDHRLALARKGIVFVGGVKSAVLVELCARGSLLDELASACRARVRTAVRQSIAPASPTAAAIVLAVLIGDRTGLDPAVERRLQEAGTYHVIAISGGNIAILAGCLLVAGRVTALHWRIVPLASAGALAVYAAIAGGGTSVARATLMAVVYLAASALDHAVSPASAVALALAVLGTAAPLSLVEPASTLTFGATVAILVGGAQLRAFLPGRPGLRAAASLLAASTCAEAALLPLGALHFSRITLAGLLLNFAAVPLMAVVQIGGMAVVAAVAIPGGLARVLGWIPARAADALVWSGSLVELAPWLTWRVPPPSLWLVALYGCGLALLASRRRWLRLVVPHGTPVLVSLSALTATAAVWIATAPVIATSRAPVRIVALDVGQGDSTLVEIHGHAFLVDTGGLGGQSTFDVGERVVVPALWAVGIRRLDGLVVTHGDADHVGGASSVLAMLAPREIWEGVPVPGHPLVDGLRTAAARAAVAWRTVQAGDRLDFGDVRVTVLNPAVPEWERRRVRNADSIALELRYGEVSVVLMGDVDVSVEPLVAARLAPSPLRVLKVGHHGSQTSSGAEFIRAAAPRLALVSCGRRNRFGHPAPQVIRRLETADCRVFRTDRDGAISIETDGRSLSLSTFTGLTVTIRSATPTSVASQPPPASPLARAIARWLERTWHRGPRT